MKRIIVIACSVFFGGLLMSGVVAAQTAPVIFETHFTNTNSSFWGRGDGLSVDKIAQKYTPQNNQTLCSVEHQVAKYANPTDSLTMSLYGGAAGGPEQGTLLASVTLPSSALIANTASYTAFPLGSCIGLQAGTNYLFVFTRSNPTSANGYISGFRTADEYSYSSYWQYNGFSPLGWQQDTNKEWSLRLIGPSAPPPKEPVIIVPGILGTRLNRVSDGEEVWPNITKMLKPFNDEDIYLNELILDPDGRASTTLIAPTKIVDKVSIKTIYKNLTDAFSDAGYSSSTELFTVPYDWRFDLKFNLKNLDNVVQAALLNSPTGKVSIVAHSFGGLLVKEYLRQSTTTTFVDKLILAGVPELGSAKAFKALSYGDDFDFNIGGLSIFNQKRAKIISQNMPAVYQLLPSRNYLASIGSYIVDYSSSSPGALTYDQSRELMLRNSIDSRNPFLLAQADSFHQTIDSVGFNVPINKIYRISGCQNPETIGDIRINSNHKFNLDPADGDGTVPLKSATYSPAGADYFALYTQTGINHTGLVSDSRTVDLIRDIVVGSSTPIVPTGVSMNQLDCGLAAPNSPNQTTIVFSTHSPVTLHIYDAQGRHVGPDANGDIELGIPGSSYERIEDNSFAFVPGGVQYRIVTNATDKGSFDLKAKVFSGIAIQSTATYLAIPLEGTSTIAQMQFSSSNIPGALQLDSEGDDVIDASIAPTILAGAAATDSVPPSIDIQSPDDIDYPRVGALPITLNLSDTESGVVTSTVSLDGILRTGSTSLDLFFEKLGPHHLVVNAYDKAGNVNQAEQDFTFSANATSSIADIERAYSLGWISKKNIKTDLVNDLKAIIKLDRKIVKLQTKIPIPGKPGKTQKIEKQIEKLEARIDRILGQKFVGELEKKYQKQLISGEAYSLLKEDVEWMINN